jgi:hypothetical protein
MLQLVVLSVVLGLCFDHVVGGTTNGQEYLGFNTGLDQPELIFNLTAQRFGAGWVRLWEDEWAWQQNATDYRAFVVQAQLAKKFNLKVLAVCVGTPSSRSGVNDPYSDKYPPLPQYYGDFAAYCAGFAKNGADAVEIWNEPNNDGFWCPDTGGVNMTGSNIYADMVIATYPVIKAVNPNIVVVTAGLSPDGYYNSTEPYDVIHAPLHYAERLMAYPNFRSNFDAFGVHPYMFGNGAKPLTGIWGYNVWAQLPAFYALLEKYGVGEKQLWLTEFGAPSQYYNESEPDQAIIFQQYFEGMGIYQTKYPNMIGKAFIYQLQDDSYYKDSDEGYFGILRANLTAKPSAGIVAAWSFTPITKV